jgi:hypothetical protein
VLDGIIDSPDFRELRGEISLAQTDGAGQSAGLRRRRPFAFPGKSL